MTHGDRIRTMSDVELATLMSKLAQLQRSEMVAKLREKGVNIEVIETPLFSMAAHLKWLKEQEEG